MDRVSESELSFTMPCSLSRTDFEKIRNDLLELIQKSTKLIAPSKPEELAFINIDWMLVKPKLQKPVSQN